MENMMKVPLLDLKAQYESLREAMVPAMEEVLDSQYFIGGPKVAELEDAIAAYCDVEAAVGVSSGTDALLLSLMALDIGPGDEVITTAYTFFATVGTIWRSGAKPVLVDICPDTFNIDPALIEAAITPKTKAIMPVHLYGQTADMDAILEIASRHNLAVIEDAAQAIGARYKGRPAGAMGTTGCFSFFPSKNLGGLGDGGMITTNDSALADRLRQGRNHGMEPKYYHAWVGGNFRLDALQAAGLLVKLPHLDSWAAGRAKNAAYYDQRFAGCSAITPPIIRDENETVYNQYILRVPDRDGLVAHLRSKDIGCEIYYPLCMHQQACFESLGYQAGAFPVSERAASETIALPIYPELTAEQLDYVAQSVLEFVDQ
jgi:dTDP-4-amino-4,6-dideoxygalactose transaminase